MTDEEIIRDAALRMELQTRKDDIERKQKAIVDLVKHLEPVLRDLKQDNQADRLAAALGVLELAEKDLTAFVQNNAHQVLDSLERMFDLPKRPKR